MFDIETVVMWIKKQLQYPAIWYFLLLLGFYLFLRLTHLTLLPIFSDEVRTFGLEALFRQVGIYSPIGQLYTPEDKEQFLYYHESTERRQVLLLQYENHRMDGE